MKKLSLLVLLTIGLTACQTTKDEPNEPKDSKQVTTVETKKTESSTSNVFEPLEKGLLPLCKFPIQDTVDAKRITKELKVDNEFPYSGSYMFQSESCGYAVEFKPSGDKPYADDSKLVALTQNSFHNLSLEDVQKKLKTNDKIEQNDIDGRYIITHKFGDYTAFFYGKDTKTPITQVLLKK